jgi:hypothetical protein
MGKIVLKFCRKVPICRVRRKNMVAFLGVFGYTLFMLGILGSSGQAIVVGAIPVIGSIGHVLFVEEES